MYRIVDNTLISERTSQWGEVSASNLNSVCNYNFNHKIFVLNNCHLF